MPSTYSLTVSKKRRAKYRDHPTAKLKTISSQFLVILMFYIVFVRFVLTFLLYIYFDGGL